MRNRHGVEYSYESIGKNAYRFHMSDEGMNYMRFGGKEGQESVDLSDLGMFDPSGGPYVAVGSKIYWDEITGASEHPPLIVKKIMSLETGIIVEVE